MSKAVIEISDLSKQYRLGVVGRTTITEDFKRLLYKVQGKEDPFIKIGETNDRTQKGNSDYIWALRDINLTINEGDLVGIIGRNGSGKSTLLKILSRTTSPTIGEFRVKGRIASLLEVGTGFHPELTGRENVFLNGAILGMNKQEIRKQFDEIVEFSGVEKYIDTPVKRYSTGMQVRLAFAVAAHLEPEILIIDEVLAVGDQEFQDKCIGKVKDVNTQGRTVLFVSHNMSAIKSLCNKGVLLQNGQLVTTGNMDDVVNTYVNKKLNNESDLSLIKSRKGIGEIEFTKIEISTLLPNNEIHSGKKIEFTIHYKTKVFTENANYEFTIEILNSIGSPLCKLNSSFVNKNLQINSNNGILKFTINELNLNVGKYAINLLVTKNHIFVDYLAEAYSFEVNESDFYNNRKKYDASYQGVYQKFEVESIL